ncbi:MAG: leucyl aminopeptidase family protein [Gammaproteobacteria bacterium]|nr:leucyl aminopeptidase family protein [Gammaproteobacteria bacterium]
MTELLPAELSVPIRQTSKKLLPADLDKLDHLLILVPKGLAAKAWSQLPFPELLKKLSQRDPEGVVSGRFANASATGFSLAVLSPEATVFERLTLARKMTAVASKEPVLGLLAHGFASGLQGSALDALVSAALAAAARMPSLKSKQKRERRIRSLKLFAVKELPDLKLRQAEAQGNYLARWLTTLPPNKLNSAAYCRLVKKLAKSEGWDYRLLGQKELEKEGAGAFLAVAQGNPERDAGIVHLKYRPKKPSEKLLTLVGKGICFDTGGTNLKPHGAMLDMHEDMGGSAVALGSLLAISRLGLPRPVDCWLEISENMIGNRAYKPQDVITASNGVTIQVIHTDAEGRMALADTLALASRDKPGLMIDYATLTGSCVRGLTTRMSAIFSNRDYWREPLIEIGRASGERVWPFPLDEKDFDQTLESPIADIKQCTTDGMGDHIYAARFLRRFVPDSIPWLHIDLGACSHEGGLAHIPTQITGFGVRLTLELLSTGLPKTARES